jgi:putative nucleotidyltransferase with HDIG domain
MHVGRSIGLDDESLSHLYYALLLKDAGCSANAAPVAEAFGSDDHVVKRALKTTNWSNYLSAATYVARHAARGGTPWQKLRHIVGMARGGGEAARDFMRLRCERGAAIVRDLGFPEPTAEAVRSLDEHWNGQGHPQGLRGEEIPLLARICGLAQTTEVFLKAQGVKAAVEMLARRRGSWFDPTLTDVLLAEAGDLHFWRRVGQARRPAALAGEEPADRVQWVVAGDLDRVAEAFADIIDAKSPYTYRHSRGVAHIGQNIARGLGCGTREVDRAYRAGLLHDIGKLGISNRILDKPGALTAAELAEIRRHPRYSMEILSHVAAFADIAPAAAQHHERLDGSGYPWGLGSDQLDLTSRIVAVADIYDALTADRPYRDGMRPAEALRIVAGEARSGLDPDAVLALEAWVREMTPAATVEPPTHAAFSLAG